MNQQAIKYDIDNDGIVLVSLDMEGPVNKFNDELYESLLEVMDQLESEDKLTGVVLTSAKDTFIAGADLHQVLSLQPGEQESFFDLLQGVKSVIRRLEKLPVPVVSAINGACMGGGYEICLGTNQRILLDDKSAPVGLPEVGLGLLPAGGGIVRLVHLLGFKAALPLLLTGAKAQGEKALKLGFVDELVATKEELLPRAKAWLLENKENSDAAVQPWDKKGHKIPGGNIKSTEVRQMIQWANADVRAKAKGIYPAPPLILDAAIEALRVDIDTALRVESRLGSHLATTHQAKNMISTLFLQMNELKKGVGRPAEIARTTVSKVGILGAGMMGQGIAAVSAMAGVEVVLKDLSLETAERGKAYTQSLLAKKVKRGKMTESQAEAILAKITATDKAESLEGCDLIVEAIFEDVDVKADGTREAEPFLTKDGVFASNTSSLPISLLAEAANNAENFVGMHFFSPVDRMPAIEIIRGKQTSDAALAKAIDFCVQIKKIPLVVNDGLGFFTTRTLFVLLEQIYKMMKSGVHATRLENACVHLGLPVGMLEVADEVGFMTPLYAKKNHLKIKEITEQEYRDSYAVQVLTDLVSMGRTGRASSGSGFYDYSEAGKTLAPEVINKWYDKDYQISDADIRDRVLYSLIVETLRCVEEGVVEDVAVANVALILGMGLPAWTGGPLQYINTHGLENVRNRLEELTAAYGEEFTPPAIISDYIGAKKQFF